MKFMCLKDHSGYYAEIRLHGGKGSIGKSVVKLLQQSEQSLGQNDRSGMVKVGRSWIYFQDKAL